MLTTDQQIKTNGCPKLNHERPWDLKLVKAGFPTYFGEWTVTWLSKVGRSGWRWVRLERYLPMDGRKGRRSLRLCWNGARFAGGTEYIDLVERYQHVFYPLESALKRLDTR